MIVWMLFLTLWMMGMTLQSAIPALQPAPPAIADYAAELEYMGRVTVIAATCAGGGFITNDEAQWVGMIEDVDRRAVEDGLEQAEAVAAFARGLAKEKQHALAILAHDGDDEASRALREKRVVDYLTPGCAEVVTKYPSAFQAVPLDQFKGS